MPFQGLGISSRNRSVHPLTPQEAVNLMRSLPPEIVSACIKIGLERNDVRREYARLLPLHGQTFGIRGKVTESAVTPGETDTIVHTAKYYNAPTACVVAITRRHPETNQLQLVVGKRPDRRNENGILEKGYDTLIGGYFNPFTPQECRQVFEVENKTPRQVHQEYMKKPTMLPHEDHHNMDINLLATVRNEAAQEANIFLMPKELSKEAQKKLEREIRDKFPKMQFSYDYTVTQRHTMWSTVGSAELDCHTNIIGVCVMAHDLQDTDEITAGDDIAEARWVNLRDLSAGKRPIKLSERESGKVYVGSMKYGDKQIIHRAFGSINREIPIEIRDDNQKVAYEGTAEELAMKIGRICRVFGLEYKDVIGMLPNPPIGEEAADYDDRQIKFMELHYGIVAKHQYDNGHVPELRDLFLDERQLLKEFAPFAANPDMVMNRVEQTTPDSYKREFVKRQGQFLVRFDNPTKSIRMRGGRSTRHDQTAAELARM